MSYHDVNDAVSDALGVAGLDAEAEAVRTASACPGEAVAVLRRVAEEARGPWESVLQEVCFWAEAAIWAEWSSDQTAYFECRERLTSAIADGYVRMSPH